MGDSGVPRVACVGAVAHDVIAVVPHMPGPDERVEASEVMTAGGGPAATAAVAMARQGIDVEFIGVVGGDPEGDTVIAQLEAEGVGTAHIERRADIATTRSLVLVCTDTETRTIAAHPSAPPPRDIPAGFDWVHVDQIGYQALPRPGAGTFRISVDDGNPIDGLDLSRVDLYVPTMSVLRRRFGGDESAAGDAALRAGAKAVVATGGSAGSTIWQGEQRYRAAALPVAPRSTLGAGDVFHGALLAAIVSGEPVVHAATLANVCAGLSCRAIDGRSGIPYRDEAREWLSRLPTVSNLD